MKRAKASDAVYIVEKIVDQRKSKKCKRKVVYEYLIKWKGFGPKFNTWEPESNIFDKKVIEKFWDSKTKKESIRKNSVELKETPKDILPDCEDTDSTFSEPFPGSDSDPDYQLSSDLENERDDEIGEEDNETGEEDNETGEGDNETGEGDNETGEHFRTSIANVEEKEYEDSMCVSDPKPLERDNKTDNVNYSKQRGSEEKQDKECMLISHPTTSDGGNIYRLPENLNLSASKNHKKRYFCSYCNKLVTNFGRHLLYLHKNETDVKEILTYPIGHPVRMEKIAVIRREFQHHYNTNPQLNTGTLIVSRRPSQNKHRTARHYVACSNCKQMFSKLSLRVHFAKCSNAVKGSRNAVLNSRQFQMYIHSKASTRLAKLVLAGCRDDTISREISYDELCIAYGNKLCRKYQRPQHTSMIRARLRELAKLILESKKIKPQVKSLKDILVPSNYNLIVESINNVAGFHELSGVYRAPATAYSLGLHIKEVSKLLKTEYIKENNAEMRTSVSDLLCLMEEGFPTDINKTVSEDQSQKRRHKKVILPTADDINALKLFLQKGSRESYKSLQSNFTHRAWKDLAGYTLISLQLFNRRRAGELERILIEDYKTYQFLNVEDNIFKHVNDDLRLLGKTYARFFIRGKLNRQVSVIISREIINYIEILLKYRVEYGINSNNPYVFGITGRNDNCYLRACQLMRYYAVRCGAPHPLRLRGTELRKQIATACKVYNLPEPIIEDLADHLGHNIGIHKSVYRQSLGIEVPAVTKVLLQAMGEQDSDNECDSHESDKENPISSENNLITVIQEEACESGNEFQAESPIPGCSNSYQERHVAEDENDKSPIPGSSNRSQEKQFDGDGTTKKRISWSDDEISAIRRSFGDYIETGIVPTYAECHQARVEHSCLIRRTPPQIKSFVAHQTYKKRTKNNPNGKKPWSTIEKSIVKKEFAVFLNTKTLPSLKKCEEVISSYPGLNLRTPAQLKAFLNNCNKKNASKNTTI